MQGSNKTDAARIVVYRAAHPVEAKQVRSWLVARGMTGIEIEDRVFRARSTAAKNDQELYNQSGFVVLSPPDRAARAREILEEARAAGRSFAPDESDLYGLG